MGTLFTLVHKDNPNSAELTVDNAASIDGNTLRNEWITASATHIRFSSPLQPR
jgi:hypothetical protein